LTKPNSKKIIQEFYARVYTPAVADAIVDASEVQRRIENPDLVEQNKLFPNSNWEFWKPTRADIIGFALCWVGVLIIVGLYLAIFSL